MLASSPFGYGHCPDGGAAPGDLVVNGARLLAPAAAATSMVSDATRDAGRDQRAARGPLNVIWRALVVLFGPTNPDFRSRLPVSVRFLSDPGLKHTESPKVPRKEH